VWRPTRSTGVSEIRKGVNFNKGGGEGHQKLKAGLRRAKATEVWIDRARQVARNALVLGKTMKANEGGSKGKGKELKAHTPFMGERCIVHLRGGERGKGAGR